MALHLQQFRQDHLDYAIERGFQSVWSSCTADGAADGTTHAGPLYSGLALVARKHTELLDDDDRTQVVNWMLSCQRADGSYPASPHSRHGSLDATVCAYAGLQACGVADSSPGQRRAKQYIDNAGGFIRATPLYYPALAISGLLKPNEFPAQHLIFQLIPGAKTMMSRKMTHWAMLTATLLPLILQGVANRNRPASWRRHPLRALEQRLALQELKSLQSPTGSLCGVLIFTTSMMMAYRVMGLSPDSEQLQAAQRWLNAKRITNENGMEYMAFDATTWNTASLIRTAMQADISPHDPRIANSIAWLIAQQTTVDAPKTWQNPKPFAPRTGAWAFHAGRSLSPDCDTTGRALDALGHVLQKSPLPGVQEAVRKGLAWLLPMQNEDGGWPSMTRDLGTKPSGPITTNGFVPPMTVPEMVAAALNPPLMMQDPSTAPMSGRIITGIKNCQADGTQSAIDAAIDFLKVQQWHNRWWGRWEVNYIAGTAFSLIGATTCGVDSKEPWLANAAAWLESQQNDDGGWGESSETYYDWQAPGPFPSRPDLTAKVVLALLRSGNPNSKHLSKAIGYLLAAQDDNGCWNTMSDQDVVIPPDFLYTNPLTTQLDVLAALTCYQRAEQG